MSPQGSDLNENEIEGLTLTSKLMSPYVQKVKVVWGLTFKRRVTCIYIILLGMKSKVGEVIGL